MDTGTHTHTATDGLRVMVPVWIQQRQLHSDLYSPFLCFCGRHPLVLEASLLGSFPQLTSHCVETSSHFIVTFPPHHLDLSSVWTCSRSVSSVSESDTMFLFPPLLIPLIHHQECQLPLSPCVPPPPSPWLKPQ